MEKEELNKASNEILNKVAKDLNYNDGNEMVEAIAEGLNSTNKADVATAKGAAKAVVQTLTPLLFDQYVNSITYSSKYGEFASRYFFKVVDEGYGTQIIQPLPVGPKNTTTPIDKNVFVPDAQTAKFIEQVQINIYTSTSTEANLQFAPEGFCSEIELTIPEYIYIPFFKSGNPEKYFSQLRKQIDETTGMVIFDKIAKMLTTSFNPQTSISGSATNSFECWTKEIFPAINQMCLPNIKYNYDNSSKYISAADKQTLKILMSVKTWTNLRTNLMSQLYRNDMFKDGVLDENNVELLGYKLNLGNGTQAITLEASEYIDDNTIIVYEPELIKWVRQYSATESQFFAKNFTIYYHHYETLAAKLMPWGKCFKYTNNNLNTNPDGAN